jgi:hypothetical protein
MRFFLWSATVLAGDRMVVVSGGKIHVFALPEGRRLGQPCPIVGDAPINYGMAAAYGRVYLVTHDGTLSCYAP